MLVAGGEKLDICAVGTAAVCDLLILFLNQHQKIAACGSAYREGARSIN